MPAPARQPTTAELRPEPKELPALLPNIDRLPALLAIPRAAELLGISRASAYRYATSGELPTKRLGGRIYIITAQIRHLFIDDMRSAA